MSSHHWPILLSDGELELRPLRLRDRMKWNRVRNRNREWLQQWEATLPTVTVGPSATVPQLPSFFSMIANFNREARNGRSFICYLERPKSRWADHAGRRYLRSVARWPYRLLDRSGFCQSWIYDQGC